MLGICGHIYRCLENDGIVDHGSWTKKKIRIADVFKPPKRYRFFSGVAGWSLPASAGQAGLGIFAMYKTKAPSYTASSIYFRNEDKSFKTK